MVTHQTSSMSSFVRRTIDAGKKFTDNDFPANSQSLFDHENNNGGLDKAAMGFYNTIVWRRLSDIYAEAEGGMEVFKSGIEPSDAK